MSAQAGHPPPVLVSCGTARLLARPSGLLLGTVPTAEYHLAYEAVEALLDRLDPPTAEDDVCVVAVRVRP